MKKSCLNFNSFGKILAIAFFCVVFVILFHKNVLAVAGINRTINFQGKLVNNPAATNVTDTSYTVIFTIYDKAGGGTDLWHETQTVTTADGIFRVALGSSTAFPANFNFNWDGLYLGVKVNSDSEMTPRVQLAAVPYAFNSEKVSGLTVQDTSGAASTSGTLQIANAKTINLGTQNLTFTTSGDTTLTLPTAGTLLTNTAAAVQTITSTESTGTILGITDSTALTGAIKGLVITLSGTNAQDQTGLEFNLSNASGSNVNDIVGTGSTWKVSRAGALTVASCSGCGAVAGGGSNWTLDTTNGLLRPNNNTLDLLIGGIATTSAKFAFTGLSDLNHQTQASFSGQLIVMPNNGYSGRVGIGTTNPATKLDVAGGIFIENVTGGGIFLDNAGLFHTPAVKGHITFGHPTNNEYVDLGYDVSNDFTWNTAAGGVRNFNIINSDAGLTLTMGKDTYASTNTFIVNGNVGIGTTSPAGELHVTRPLSFGTTGKALVIFDQIENQDIFTASASGAPIFTITRAGGIALGTNGLSYGTSSDCLKGGATATWGGCGSSSGSNWTLGAGFLTPNNSTVDLLFGGQSTPAAAFRVTGQGSPFAGTTFAASVSANTTFAAFVIDQKGLGDIFAASSAGVVQFSLSRGGNASTAGNFYTFGGLTPTIQSAQNRTLTIGGDRTGNIVLTPNNGSAGFITVNGSIAQIGATTFSSGTGVVSLNGDTSIITGKTLTLGGITANDNQVLFAAHTTGVVTAVGTTTTPNLCLLSGASIPSWGNCPAGTPTFDLYWNQGTGALFANNSTVDFLAGGQSTPAAAFRVTGQGSPFAGTTFAASVSANTSFAAFVIDQRGLGDIFTASAAGVIQFRLDRNGNASTSGSLYTFGGVTPTIQSTQNRTLTIGGDKTGNITLSPNNGTGGKVIFAGGAINLGGSDGTSADCLKGGASAAWGSCGSGGGSNWTLGSTGFLAANNSTLDILLGGQSTPAASFRVTGQGSPFARTQVAASVSANTTFAGFVIDQKGTGDIFTASTSGVPRFSVTNTGGIKLGELVGTSAQCLLGGATASWGTCGGGGSLFTHSATFTYLTTTTDDFVLGASTVAAATFFMDVSAGDLYLGTNNTGGGGINGILTLYSSGSGIADPTISADASGNLTLSATEAGASVIIGDGSGNISLSLSAAADVLIADKTVTLAGTYTGDDFMFMRVFTGGANTQSGSILKIHDTSGGTGTINGDLLLVNSALTSGNFTGNLATFQHNSVTKLTIQGSGTSPVLKITGSTTNAGLVVDNAGVGDLLTASASGVTKFTITNSGNLTATGTLTGLTGLTLASGPITLGAVTGSGLCITGGATAAWGSCGSGGGGTDRWQVSNGLLFNGNQTVDFAIGGTSTGSADFIFGNLNGGGGVPTATFSGNLVMNSRPNSPQSQIQQWTKISDATAGTIASGGTAGIASISASVIYNGSLYVGTATTNATGVAEVYRYNGPTLGTWTQVSGTAGTIGGNATTGIASVSAMTVFDGKIYVGTSKANAAEIYRYEGGTTWTVVSQGTAGRILTTTLIDGVTALAVYNGKLYAGTKEGGRAELYRYEVGSTWTLINSTTIGTFVTTNTVNVDAITSMSTANGFLYLGTLKNGDADVLRYNGGQATGASTTFLSMNNGGTSGSYLINNAASAAFTEVTAMAVYNGAIVVAIRKTAQHSAEVLSLTPGSQNGATSPDSWQRLNSAAGTITTGGTANIDSVSSLAVYNGRLYAGTWEQSRAEIYRYETPGVWTKVSGGAAGAISGATGATTGIYSVTTLQANTDMLYAMTSKFTNGAEVYSYQAFLDQSYSLTFRATPGLAGGVQSGIQEEASIFFLASSSAIANNKSSQNGVFVFTHSITTRNGAYDVAEDYPTRDDTLEPGDLISIDTNERGYVKKSNGKSDSALIGIYSENPALRLSETGERIDGSKTIPVALVGRVSLKVSTENGEIKSGDALTSSSVPGVAMKATKAGVIVAQAMAPYEEDPSAASSTGGQAGQVSVGKIMAYVKSNSYNGTTAELFQGIDIASPNFDRDILAKLEQNKAEGLTSEIYTDRLVAGLEIFTPKLVAGEIFAKKIRADQIEGLELLVGKIKYSDSMINAFNSTNSAVLGDSIKPIDGVSLSILDSNGLATVSADLNVKGNSMFEGMITVIKSIITPNLIVSDFATFFGDVVFKKNINVEGTATFNSDTAGFAVVNKGKDTVTVEFDNEYLSAPVITASIALDKSQDLVADRKLEDTILNGSISYVITGRTTKGFTIRLNKVAVSDISFSWVALSVKNAKTQSSNTNKMVNPEATKSAGFQSILNQLNSQNNSGGGT